MSSGNRLFVAGEHLLAQNFGICIQRIQCFLLANRTRTVAITLVWRKLASRPRACRYASMQPVRFTLDAFAVDRCISLLHADLLGNGDIVYEGQTFRSPSSWSLHVKRLVNPQRLVSLCLHRCSAM